MIFYCFPEEFQSFTAERSMPVYHGEGKKHELGEPLDYQDNNRQVELLQGLTLKRRI